MMANKITLLLSALLITFGVHAQTATPFQRPHQNFVDASGLPCANCQLFSYAAGTTTPQPTYTDSTEGSQNTNPIILDAAGGASIWMGSTPYKFVLESATGATLWTEDNVTGGGALGACTSANAIIADNSTATGITCDALITINTAAHTINVGGPLPAAHFTMTNLNPVSVNWTFDVTSPATAFGSISPLTTKGDLLGYSTAPGRVPVGADGTVVTADSTQPFGWKWATPAASTTLTGDVTGSGSGTIATTLATVNASPGACGDATHVCQITTNDKGLVTAQTAVAVAGVYSAGHLGAASCSTGSSSYSTCTSVVSFSPAFADTNYYPVCSGSTPSDGRAAIIGCTPTSSNTVTVTVATEGSVSVSYADLYVHAFHP